MFDDKRYFTSLKQLAEEEGIDIAEYYKPIETLIDGVKTKVSILICEDIWNINQDYPLDPLELAKQHNPDLIVVPSASPF
jgi:NAD+ synthase (glutamine-hydrolysing)